MKEKGLEMDALAEENLREKTRRDVYRNDVSHLRHNSEMSDLLTNCRVTNNLNLCRQNPVWGENVENI